LITLLFIFWVKPQQQSENREIEIVINLDFFNKLNEKYNMIILSICIQILLLSVANDSGSFFTEETTISVVKSKSADGLESSVDVFSTDKLVRWAEGRYLSGISNSAVKDTELSTIGKSLVVLESWRTVWRIVDQRNRDLLVGRERVVCSEIEEELVGRIILSESGLAASSLRADIWVAGRVSIPAVSDTWGNIAASGDIVRVDSARSDSQASEDKESNLHY